MKQIISINPQDFTAAPVCYNSPAYQTLEDAIKRNNEALRAAEATAKQTTGKAKRAAQAKAAECRQQYDFLHGELETERAAGGLRYSKSFLAARLIARVLEQRAEAMQLRGEILAELNNPDGDIGNTLGWHMSALVAADWNVKFFTNLIRHWHNRAAEEGPATFDMLWDVLQIHVQRFEQDLLRAARRPTSRSTSTTSNVIEDIVNSAKADLIPGDDLGAFSQIEYYRRTSTLTADEAEYPITLPDA